MHSGSVLTVRQLQCCGDNTEPQSWTELIRAARLPLMNMEWTALRHLLHPSHTRAHQSYTQKYGTFQKQWAARADRIAHMHTCGIELLIQLSRECFVRQTVTQYLLMRQKPFCIGAVLTGCMLIITNGSKKSWCSTHWEVIKIGLTGACNAAAWFSLTPAL